MLRFLTLTLTLTSTLALTFLSCTSNEIGTTKEVDPEAIYFDYKIWGEEGNEDVTLMLQYKYGGKNGTTLVLEEPSRVELDGKLVPSDSSNMTGAFYEVIKPVQEFSGKHSIVYTDINGKQHKEEFNFRPITLRTKIPVIVKRDNLVFELEGLEALDHVRVIMNDTSFTSEGINRVDEVRHGRVIITRSELEDLKNGPIHIELFKEVDRPVRSGTREGGRLTISYGIKREFELVQ